MTRKLASLNVGSMFTPVGIAIVLLGATCIVGRAADAAATSAKKTIRIRFGSTEAFTDSSGNVWEGERNINGGQTIERDASLAVANTKDAALFRAEHYSMDDITIPVPNGKYTAKLYFAETYEGISGTGQRVFSFNVQGKEFKDFDIFAKAGGANKAYVETVPVEVTNGTFKVTFTPNIENPMINALEISPTDAISDAGHAGGKAVLRMVAGRSAPYKDSEGNTWEAEKGFEGGQTIERDSNLAIANTKEPGLYRSEHYSMDSFSCPVPNGKYVAKLHFAETYDGISGAGQRVFSFNVQGKEFKDFDVWVKAGGANKAYIESVPVEVTNGTFKITFTPNIENPQINAIELYAAQ